MPHFTFQAKNRQGQIQTGIIEADTDFQARSDLSKVNLEVISLKQSSHPPQPHSGNFFAFKFKAQKENQPIEGTIDAPDEATAKTRLQNEFGFHDIQVQDRVQVWKRPNFKVDPASPSPLVKKFTQSESKPTPPLDPISHQPSSPPPASIPASISPPTFWSSAKSFIFWLLFIYFLFFLLSQIFLGVDLGFFTDLLQDTRQNPIFIWLLISLFVVFFLIELPHQLRVWQKSTSLISAAFTSSFLLLVPLGLTQGWLLTLRFQDTIPEQVISWHQLLNWPLTFIVLLFVISFRALPSSFSDHT